MSENVRITLDGLLDTTLEEVERSIFNAAIIKQDEEHRFVTDEQVAAWDNKADISIATANAHGLMSATDKSKLDGIAKFANYYTHPSTHPATIITEDATHRFVTDIEKANWNTKAGSVVPVTTTNNGLMLASDKVKLDGISAGATSYSHPTTHPASMIVEDTSRNFITVGERNKLSNIEAEANKYIHPVNHAASIITQDANNRFFTDAERVKLNGIEVGANNYSHPTTHPATIITQTASYRFVSDTQIANWNDKYTKAEIDNKLSGQTTGLDWKPAVNSYSDLLAAYPTPADGWTVNIKDTDLTYKYTGSQWIAISANSIPLATTLLDGKMSKEDKTKLDGIATSANNYVHPATHSPSVIAQNATNRFVTDAEKADWNTKASGTHTHNNLSVADTRNTVINVGDYKGQFATDFKLNTKIGNPDSGTYSAVCTISPYSDSSGGGNHQLAFTENGSIYHRYGTVTGGWGTWGKLAKMSDVTNATSGAATLNGHTIDEFVLKAGDSTMTGVLTVPTLKISGSEGWVFRAEPSYFGTNQDTRIIELIDNNSSNGNVDGGLVVLGYTPTDNIKVELLQIRNNSFKFKGHNVFHEGNFDPSLKANVSHTHNASQISGTVESANVAFSIPTSDVGGNIWID